LSSSFNNDDHSDLKDLVEKMINHDSVYASTTPEEMQKFVDFLENCAPYDIVVDGLNALYSHMRRNLVSMYIF